jgi:hypothetical protein
LSLFFGVALLLMSKTAAAGTTYNVSTAADLQAAVRSVNAGPGGDLIILAPGLYRISSTLVISSRDVTIQGDPSAPSLLDGGGVLHILYVGGTSNISIKNLTFQNAGTAISYESRGVFSGTGVTITGSSVGFYPGDSGGATFFTNSTIANNTGSGIVISCAEFHLTNVTVSNNARGVVFNFPCGEKMQIINSLIVRNTRDCGGGGAFVPVGKASFDSDGSCVGMGFGPGLKTMSLASIGLGSLSANGGPTMTEAIPGNSAAVNAGDPTVCPATDQRGFLRNLGKCDIGAYEFGAVSGLGNTPAGLNVSVSPAPGVTVTFSQVTTSGDTTATTGGPPPPTGFKVDGVIYNISTTAAYAGTVKVCLPYDPMLGIVPLVFHYENVPPPPAWVNRTTSVDTVNRVVCGTAPSLSPFAVLHDVMPPTLVVPGDIIVDATGPGGVIVKYVVTATDNLDPNPVVTCTPSGNVFPINPLGVFTTVTCTASDASGNVSPPGTFHIHVRGAGEQLANLEALVRSFGLDKDVERHLVRLLRHAARELRELGEERELEEEEEGLRPVCSGLREFVRVVAAFARADAEREREEKRGAPLTQEQAGMLTAAAVRVEAVLACPPERK